MWSAVKSEGTLLMAKKAADFNGAAVRLSLDTATSKKRKQVFSKKSLESYISVSQQHYSCLGEN